MRSFLITSCLLSLTVLLCGCPYDSEVPLDVPKIKVDPNLLGRWKSSNDFYIISAHNAYVYNIAAFDSKEAEGEQYSGYISVINGVSFMNLVEKKLPSKSRKYFFAKVEIKSGQRYLISVVTENILEQFNSSAALRKFFEDNMHNSYFFEREKIMFSRTGK